MGNSLTQQAIIEHYVQAYNRFDIDGMLQDLDKDVIFENVTDGQVNLSTHGINEFKTQAESARAYFKERIQKITDFKFNNNEVVAVIDYKAILAKDFPNGLKAGDTISLQGKSIFTFKDGKIIKIKDES